MSKTWNVYEPDNVYEYLGANPEIKEGDIIEYATNNQEGNKKFNVIIDEDGEKGIEEMQLEMSEKIPEDLSEEILEDLELEGGKKRKTKKIRKKSSKSKKSRKSKKTKKSSKSSKKISKKSKSKKSKK
jgi:hypothetical protein